MNLNFYNSNISRLYVKLSKKVHKNRKYNIFYNIVYFLQLAFVRILLKFIYSTNKKLIFGRENYQQYTNKNISIIFSVWHGQLLSTICTDLRYKKIYTISSNKRDTDIICDLLKIWGSWKFVRANQKKGSILYREMLKTLSKKRTSFFITPDGPEGPNRIPKLGILRAAQLTNSVIIPVSICSTKSWIFKSWDHFVLDKPFGKIFLMYGKPLTLDKDLDYSSCSQLLINSMKEVENINLKNIKNK